MKKTFKITCVILLCFYSPFVKAKDIDLSSPNKNLKLVVSIDETVNLNIWAQGKLLFDVKDINLNTDRGIFPNQNAKIINTKQLSIDRIVLPEIKEKFAKIPEKYNELLITFKDKNKLQLRVYNDGIAYRFILDLPGEIKVISDNSDFVFDKTATLTFQKDNNNPNSDYEKPYIVSNINDLKNDDMGNLPAMVQNANGYCILFMEADTKDYPCMWIKKTTKGLSPHYWGVPSGYNDKGNSYNRRSTTGNKDYIAQTKASRNFPWKVFAIAEKETELLTNQLVYLLGEECRIKDTSWIKPGWVTFDWWARRGLYGVDFKAGINMETAKYMIDFASDFGIKYFLFDDGWTQGEDLTRPIQGLDIAEVVRYAKQKNVDVMLWVTYALLDDQMETALKQFEEWGIKGIKIDFMNRSDQEVVGFYWRAAEECAKHKMVLDFHGAYRPDGLRRAYPNVLTREALIEFEYSGGTDWDNPDHHCTLPFIRNVAGPMDYIPGTMNNATKNDFRPNGDSPMGQGTRAHSLALAVITESPMQMLSDAQSDYYREKECTTFLTKIPVEWDEIVPLKGKVGDYVALARRKGNDWYLAAITDWTPRKMELNLDFLNKGKEYTAEIFKDGINADIRAIDYKKEIKKIKGGDKIELNLAPGGGWVARIY